MIIDVAVKNDCWNMRQSYGEICVGCGCCAKDLKERAKNRAEVLAEYIEEDKARLETSEEDYKPVIKARLRKELRNLRYYTNLCGGNKA